MHPDRVFWVVAHAKNTNDTIAGVRFVDSISQIPVSAAQVEKLRAVGFGCTAYEYHPGIKVDWNSQGHHTAFVEVPDPEPTPEPKGKKAKDK